MFRIHRYVGPLVMAAATIVPLAGAGCAARVQYRDSYHNDNHRWNDGETRAERVWLGDRHYEYREYDRLNHEQQQEYWKWRHDHPGRY